MAAPSILHCLLAIFLLSCAAQAQLTTDFYDDCCPDLESIVRTGMIQAVRNNRRIGASLVRLFFHDCFVQGCDGSVLLDLADGEKFAIPNNNSLLGFEVIDAIKASVEDACPGVVSCADILALTARDGTFLLGGPTWSVPLGRRDSTTANKTMAEETLPPPSANLTTLIQLFGDQGLLPAEMTALSGAHTIGLAHCNQFNDHIYNDTNIDPSFAALRRQTCSRSPNDRTLAPIDVQTPTTFDAAYYRNLMARRGLFHSDQVLFNGGSQDALVRQYSASPALFRSDFAKAMIKMGDIRPLTGTDGEIRDNCRCVNS